MLAWSVAGRRVLGVPADVIAAARKLPEGAAGDHPAALMLLDWLSLTLPRWRAGAREIAFLLGVGCFALSSLFVLGFVYRLEMAQALVLLILPFAALFAIELRLAGRMALVVAQAQSGQIAVDVAAGQAARAMGRHRLWVTLMSVLAVIVTAYRGAVWMVSHPLGF